ncbi:MAG TPA: prephenate dehydrogenase/arogenate dehydrogenase family protein [Thermoplasmata archaeon]|nr:prephenate dehydrogenase/arogenate dehydrogenase family protein [Thermoplasmata archaeon]
MTAEDLEALRGEIARTDEEILALLRRRLDVVERVGRLKSELRLPIRDFRVEAQVARRFEQASAEAGLGETFGRSLAQLVIDRSVAVQEQFVDRSFGGERSRVLVVGGAGNMGGWLCRFLRAQGHAVTVLDPSGVTDGFPAAASLQSAVAECGVVILATPIAATDALLQEIVGLRPAGVVFDICSVKAPLLPTLREAAAAGIRVTSVHPMFGPTAGSLAGRNVLLCDCGCPEATDAAADLFRDTGANLQRLPVEDHDDAIAIVLGLSHATNLAFFSVLARLGRDHEELARYASTTFARQAATAREVAFENQHLYYEIQRFNPHTPAVLEALAASVEQVRTAAASPTPDAFAELMTAGRRVFRGAS